MLQWERALVVRQPGRATHECTLWPRDRKRALVAAVVEFHAKKRKRTPPAATLRSSVQHQCSAACFWHMVGDFCFCDLTGNLHVCGNDHCDSMITTTEHRVCSLTAVTFPLDFTTSWDHFRYSGQSAVRAIETGNDATQAHAETLRLLDTLIDGCGPDVDLARRTVLPWAFVVQTGTVVEQMAWLAARAALLYGLAKTSARFEENRPTYRLTYHCLVVIYSTLTSFWVPVGTRRVVVVPNLPLIAGALPEKRAMLSHRDLDVTPSW